MNVKNYVISISKNDTYDRLREEVEMVLKPMLDPVYKMPPPESNLVSGYIRMNAPKIITKDISREVSKFFITDLQLSPIKITYPLQSQEDNLLQRTEKYLQYLSSHPTENTTTDPTENTTAGNDQKTSSCFPLVYYIGTVVIGVMVVLGSLYYVFVHNTKSKNKKPKVSAQA